MHWQQVGDSGDWQGTIAAAVAAGRLYTIERSGGLYCTDLASGAWEQLEDEFAGTELLMGDGNRLYTIEGSGNLYAVNPSDGSWSQVGDAGDWRNSVCGLATHGRLFTIEGACLYVTDPHSGAWETLSDEFAGTGFLVGTDAGLFTIDDSGCLYHVSPSNGAWDSVGERGGWADTIAATTMGGALYTIESGGTLFETDLRTGRWAQRGDPDFADTEFMVAHGRSLYTIESSGSLYEITP